MKVVNTTQLRKLIARAVELDFNRKGPYNIINQLDPDGQHCLKAQMMHADSQIRCRVLAKVNRSNEPAVTILDVTLEDFNALPDHKG